MGCLREYKQANLFGLSPASTIQTNRTEFNCRGLRKYRIHVCAAGDEIVCCNRNNSVASERRKAKLWEMAKKEKLFIFERIS